VADCAANVRDAEILYTARPLVGSCPAPPAPGCVWRRLPLVSPLAKRCEQGFRVAPCSGRGRVRCCRRLESRQKPFTLSTPGFGIRAGHARSVSPHAPSALYCRLLRVTRMGDASGKLACNSRRPMPGTVSGCQSPRRGKSPSPALPGLCGISAASEEIYPWRLLTVCSAAHSGSN